MIKERATVVVIDGWGRASALVDAYGQSENVNRIVAIPGNDLAGINTDKEVKCFASRNSKPVGTTNIPEIIEICHKEGAILVDVAQDDAVAEGLVDALQLSGIPVIGPTLKAGQIEWSKKWQREFGQRHGLKQPEWWACTTLEEGDNYINSHPNKPRVVKADGLAQGKGVRFGQTNKEIRSEARILRRAFPYASRTYLYEEMLHGEEFSSYAICDGKNHVLIGHAQDHKRVLDHDEGENTGGMGCSSPPLLITPEIAASIDREIFTPTLEGLRNEHRPYKGILYLGGMVTADGETYVIEFNARWGDPEAQVILPGLVGDLFEISMAAVEGDITKVDFHMDGKSRVVVAGVSRGYPGEYSAVKGREVHGLEEARKLPGIKVYGAGIKVVDGVHTASGGRLFYIVGEGDDVIEAKENAYRGMDLISIDGDNLHYRRDIGYRDVARIK